MSKIDILKEILVTAESLQEDLTGSDITKAKVAEECYLRLVDRFYEDCEDTLAYQQYLAANRDFEYFLRLVKLAIAYEQEEESEKGKSRNTLH